MVRAIKEFFRATDFVQANPAWAVERMKSPLGYAEGTAKAMIPILRYGKEGKINPRVLENVVTFIVEYGMAPKDKVPPLERLYDKSFGDQASP